MRASELAPPSHVEIREGSDFRASHKNPLFAQSPVRIKFFRKIDL